MQIQDTLKEAIKLIHSDGKRYYWAGQFVEIHAQALTARYRDNSLEPIIQAMQNIHQDIWNICALVTRMEWFRAWAIQDKALKDSFWSLFTSVDIEHFHVELRSILDYTANILGIIAKKPGQVPGNSFRELYQWLDANPQNVTRFGKEQSDLVLSAPWYSELRVIRDSVLHRGAFTLVFGSPNDGIIFQVLSGHKQLINIDSLMWNENVVDFQLYAGLYFARVIVLLEKLGYLLAYRIQEHPSNLGAKSYWSGFGILREWMSKLLDKSMEGNIVTIKKNEKRES